MNKAILIGRIVRDPEVREGATSKVAKYTLAVDRKFTREGEPTADFINCVVFGNGATFTEKYFKKGMKVAIAGRIQTGSYTDRDGRKVNTTDIVVEEQNFCESKKTEAPAEQNNGDWFSIPDGIDEKMPWE